MIGITGSAGFIGYNLLKYLRSMGNIVYGIDNYSNASCKNEWTQYGDIRYYEDVDDFVKQVDIVYHLAAQINVDKSILHPQETIDINLIGTLNILEACRKYHKTMVFASTSEIYGTHDTPISEKTQTNPQSPYAVSKLAADKLCKNYHDLYETEVYIVRCFNTFGPYQSDKFYGAVIPLFAKAFQEKRKPKIFGDGKQLRDYTFVDDVVQAYEFIPHVKELNGEPINVGTGKTVSINEICKLITKYYKIPFDVDYIESRKGEVMKLQANISKLKSYNFEPRVSFQEGLERYLAWRG